MFFKKVSEKMGVEIVARDGDVVGDGVNKGGEVCVVNDPVVGFGESPSNVPKVVDV